MKLSKKVIGYFRARLKNRIHEAVLQNYLVWKEAGGSQAEMAERLHCRRSHICRLLGGPSNYTLDTMSDLLLAMGLELEITVKPMPDVKVKLR